MAALKGTGGNCEAVLGGFVTSPGWAPGLDSLGARGRNQRGDPGSATSSDVPSVWLPSLGQHSPCSCKVPGTWHLSGEMTLVPLEGVSGVQRLGIRAGSDEEAGGCKRPE